MATIDKIQLNGVLYDIKSSSFNNDDILTIDLDGAEFGEPNPVNADTLNGRLASDYVLKEELGQQEDIDASSLNGRPASDYLLKDELFPIGSIYISLNNTNPSTIFGGTWEQIQGKFLLGASSSYPANQTGGEEKHTLTVEEMPSHRHNHQGYRNVGDGSKKVMAETIISSDPVYTSSITNTGGNQPHNNMPPYLAVYMWKRTA